MCACVKTVLRCCLKPTFHFCQSSREMVVFTLEWLQFVYFINLDFSYSFKDYYFKILLLCLGFVLVSCMLEVRVHFHGVGIFLHLGFQNQVRLLGWCCKHFSHFEPSPHLWLLFLRQFLTLTHTVFYILHCHAARPSSHWSPASFLCAGIPCVSPQVWILEKFLLRMLKFHQGWLKNPHRTFLGSFLM